MKCFGQKIRNYHCKVVLLDEQELIQEIQCTSNGQELLDNVFKHLNLIETAYFGLRYIDSTGQTNWLDPGKKVIKQLEGTEPYTLYFGVKFYAADPCKLLEEITRYQFFLQIKQDILQGRLPVPFDLAAELCAYAVQSELGDYDPRRHCTGYISEFRFVSNQSPELESRITELHKSFAGQVPAVAELNYLEKVKWLDMYGVDLHPVLGEDHVDYFLGLTPSGIIVLRNKTKVGNYFWPRIFKLNIKGKYFMIRVKNKNNEEQTFGFESPSRAACKHLWKCAVEHHAFFKLVQVAPTAISSGNNKGSTLSSRFRDSGRSESSVRRRAQPQFVRTPSRRYTRRVVEGGIEGEAGKGEIENGASAMNKAVSVPQPVQTLPSTIQINTRSDSPRSVRSAPWPAPHSTKTTSYSVPSPRSVRSAGVGGNSTRERERQREYSKDRRRSASAESNSSVDSRSLRKHRHSRSRKNSDNESEISRSSGRSHHSRRRHKSSSKRDSGSESEHSHHRHKHRHRHRHNSGKYELVDSEVQWKEAQKKQQAGGVQQAAVVVSSAQVKQSSISQSSRKSGYMNSGLETESEASYPNKRRHRRHRSKSPKERLPDELKKHIDFHLVDPPGGDEQLRHIPYVKVETNSLKSSKIRYNCSIKSNRSNTSRQLPLESSSSSSTNPQKSELPSTGDSPPPPYSPPANSSSAEHKSDMLARTSATIVSSNNPTTSSSKMASTINFPSKNLSRPGSSNSFVVPPPPSKVVASNMSKGPNNSDFANVHVSATGRQRNPIMFLGNEDGGLHDLHHPSPSESPDSQKVDSHHENSDSGLGTDHQEYYKSDTFNGMGYTLPRRSSKDLMTSSHDNTKSENYWGQVGNTSQVPYNMRLEGCDPPGILNATKIQVPSDRRAMTLDRRNPSKTLDRKGFQFVPIEKYKQIIEVPSSTVPIASNQPSSGANTQISRGSRSRSSSLEMILSPLVTSTRTRL